MKVFKCNKEVTATPMNRLDFNVHRGWELPADEDGSDEGYLVEYLDGGKPNHPDHKGYISWSPKEQFDNSHTEVKESTYQERVVEEKKQLDERGSALSNFIGSSFSFMLLDKDEQERMKEQCEFMWEYSEILGARIAAWNKKASPSPKAG